MQIIAVEKEGFQLDHIRELFKEYSSELNENLCFQRFDEELKDPLKNYGPPAGALFIGYKNNFPVGCVALKALQENGVCEMKRLYVRPAYRSAGYGDEFVRLLLQTAKEKGYKKMVLDTLDRLQPAIKLYLRNGFINTSAYYTNPLTGVVYMEKYL